MNKNQKNKMNNLKIIWNRKISNNNNKIITKMPKTNLLIVKNLTRLLLIIKHIKLFKKIIKKI